MKNMRIDNGQHHSENTSRRRFAQLQLNSFADIPLGKTTPFLPRLWLCRRFHTFKIPKHMTMQSMFNIRHITFLFCNAWCWGKKILPHSGQMHNAPVSPKVARTFAECRICLVRWMPAMFWNSRAIHIATNINAHVRTHDSLCKQQMLVHMAMAAQFQVCMSKWKDRLLKMNGSEEFRNTGSSEKQSNMHDGQPTQCPWLLRLTQH